MIRRVFIEAIGLATGAVTLGKAAALEAMDAKVLTPPREKQPVGLVPYRSDGSVITELGEQVAEWEICLGPNKWQTQNASRVQFLPWSKYGEVEVRGLQMEVNGGRPFAFTCQFVFDAPCVLGKNDVLECVPGALIFIDGCAVSPSS
jgi:hypothetical protein